MHGYINTLKSKPLLVRPEIFGVYKEITSFVSTRHNGVSPFPWESLNMGYHVKDEPDRVLKNRKLLAKALNIKPENMVFAFQEHTNNSQIVGRNECGKGLLSESDALKGCDAIITSETGVCLTILLADCVPILIYDPVSSLIAAIHSGWKGTVNRIVFNTIQKMKEVSKCKSSDIIAFIGPSAGPCCYEIKEDVVSKVKESYKTKNVIFENKYGKQFFDMWKANRIQLLDAGLKERNIEISGLCTVCHKSHFFSVRGDAGISGRFAAGIMLNSK